jgi:NifU-like protein involved in Fe-S cluster formation
MTSPPPAPYPPELVAWARDRRRRGTLDGSPELRRLEGHAHNRTCGDRVVVQLGVDATGFVVAARFTGEGCALCMAGAAALTAHLEGAPLATAAATIATLRALLADAPPTAPAGLAVFSAVAPFPARHLCVTLSADAASAALATASPESP